MHVGAARLADVTSHPPVCKTPYGDSMTRLRKLREKPESNAATGTESPSCFSFPSSSGRPRLAARTHAWPGPSKPLRREIDCPWTASGHSTVNTSHRATAVPQALHPLAASYRPSARCQARKEYQLALLRLGLEGWELEITSGIPLLTEHSNPDHRIILGGRNQRKPQKGGHGWARDVLLA
jgi:hypothetical protein